MKSFCRLTAVSLLLTTGVAHPFAERRWIEVRTAHFSVVSDVGEKRASDIARRCEQLRAAFSTLMNRATTNDPAPLLIFAVNGERELAELAGEKNRNSTHAGLFVSGADENFVLIDASDDPWVPAFHEYAHELLSANTSSNVQTWFDEGFAEYFSTFDTSGQRAELGRVPTGKLQFLRRNGKLMRLADLVGVNRNSEIYNRNGPSREMFYGESWLLVHYLFDHQLIDRAEPFFNLMATGTPLDDAIRTAFGATTLKLEDELLSYAKGERFRFFSLPATRERFSERVEVQPLTEVRVAALKAEVRWHGKIVHSTKEIAEYTAEFRSLLTRDPNNSVALRGLGRALFELKDYDGALRYLRQAVESDPKDVQNHHSLSLLLSAIEESGSSSAGRGYSSRSEAEACVQVDPSFADAYRLIASSFERQGEFDKAEGMMRKAVLLSPRTEAYELNLANIELTRHEYATALTLLRELKRSSNPEISTKAEYLSSNIANNIAKE